MSSLISNVCHGYGQGRRRRVLYFSTLFQALTGVFILRKCYQIEPRNVALRSFPLYAQELTAANHIRYTYLGLQQLQKYLGMGSFIRCKKQHLEHHTAMLLFHPVFITGALLGLSSSFTLPLPASHFFKHSKLTSKFPHAFKPPV